MDHGMDNGMINPDDGIDNFGRRMMEQSMVWTMMMELSTHMMEWTMEWTT